MNRSFGGRLAHVLERCGLAMAGASCGLFVAAFLMRAQFSSFALMAAVMVIGALGFYLGIDVPPAGGQASVAETLPVAPDRVEILSAAGTFLAALAALLSAYMIVVDGYTEPLFSTAIMSCWIVGAVLQIAAGIVARMRP